MAIQPKTTKKLNAMKNMSRTKNHCSTVTTGMLHASISATESENNTSLKATTMRVGTAKEVYGRNAQYLSLQSHKANLKSTLSQDRSFKSVNHVCVGSDNISTI
jgi:fumarylacetoacetate (FAA) hydrolase family protein